MSSAEGSPQGSYSNDALSKTKHRIRWRFVLIGLGLLAFGWALPFALKAYYSSSYSQTTGAKNINIANSSARIASPKVNLATRDEITNLSEIDAKQFSPEKISYADFAESFEIPTVSTLKFAIQTQQDRQTQQPAVSVERGRTVNTCPAGQEHKRDWGCNDNMTVVVRNGATFKYYATCGGIRTSGKDLIWDLSNCPLKRNFIYINGKPHMVTKDPCDCVESRDSKLPKEEPTNEQPPVTEPPKEQPPVTEPPKEQPPVTEPTNELPPGTEPTSTESSPVSPTPSDTETSPSPPAADNSNANILTPMVSPTITGAANVNLANSNSSTGGADKFSFTYPSRFMKDTIYTVSLSLQPDGNAFETGGGNIYVTPALELKDGLEMVEKGEETLLYDRNAKDFPHWSWKIKLSENGGNLEEVVMNFHCAIVTQKTSDKWQSGPLNSPVGLPILSYIIAALSILGGGLAFIFGVAPGLGGLGSKVKFDEWLGAGAIARKNLEDEVHCTLYAPPAARAGTSFVIQVFAHLAGQAEGLYDIAKELDEEAKKQAARKLKKKIKHGSTLTFKLTMPGLEVAETEESGDWEGEPLDIQFIVSVPDDHTGGNRFGKVSVYENGEKLGTIAFRIEILARAQEIAQPAVPPFITAPMLPGETAFISYASENKAEVGDLLRLLDTVGVSYHIDIFDISPGDRWEQKLYEFIDNDDIFLLFWSKAASASEYVLKEAERANNKTGKERKNPPKIVIYHLETPPETEVPDWLKDIHYDRKWSQFSERAQRFRSS